MNDHLTATRIQGCQNAIQNEPQDGPPYSWIPPKEQREMVDLNRYCSTDAQVANRVSPYPIRKTL